MNTGTRVMADRRTRRQRTRSAERQAEIQTAMDIWIDDQEECDGTCRAGRYCIQHGDLTVADLFEIEDAW